MVALATLLATYGFRPDVLAFLTVFPPWVWLVPGFVLWFGTRGLGWRRRGVIIAGWLLFLASVGDSPRPLIRSLFGSDPEALASSKSVPQTVRVVTLNCGGFGLEPRELETLKPDVVLLQETPGRDRLAELALQLFPDGDQWLANSDTAILANGELKALDLDVPQGHFFTAAEATLADTFRCVVVSLRLEPYPVRLDIWSGDCWRSYTEVRRKRQRQMNELMHAVLAVANGRPIIVAGDFNAPPGDLAYSALKPRLTDVFPRVGTGWGGTITNDYPLLRIDQIWASTEWTPVAAWVRPSIDSDHRRLMCDLCPAANRPRRAELKQTTPLGGRTAFRARPACPVTSRVFLSSPLGPRCRPISDEGRWAPVCTRNARIALRDPGIV